MGHRMVFGAVAASVLAVPVGLTVIAANGFDPARLWTDRQAAGTPARPQTPPPAVVVQAPAGADPSAPAPAEKAEADEETAAAVPDVAAPQDDLSDLVAGLPSREAEPAPQPAPRAQAAQLDAASTARRRIMSGKGLARIAPQSTVADRPAGETRSTALLAPPEPDAAAHAPLRDSRHYAAAETNPLKLTGEHPVSTFSIDVDTASYSRVRRMLNTGMLPPPADVRPEEMINYFAYDYPRPEPGGAPFRPSVAVYPTPWNAETRLLHIGIKGAELVAAERPRANLVFLVDTSGSMQGADRLPLLKTAFRLLVEELDDDDTVAIVTYAGSAGTVLEPTRAAERRRIIDALDRLESGGSTAGAAGIREAYALAGRNFDADGVNRVILATDGDFNVGMTDIDELKGYIADKRRSGVFLSVLGFGEGNTNDGLMQVLAQNGNGAAAYIDTLKEAEKVLVSEATSTLYPIAKDVKIQIEFNPTTVSAYRLIGYESRMLRRQDFNNDRIDAGEIGSGHTVTALYEIVPAGSAATLVDDLRYGRPAAPRPAAAEAGRSDEYAFLKLRYKQPDADQSSLVELPVTRDEERDGVAALGDDMRFAAAVAAFAQKLRGTTWLQDYPWSDIEALAVSAKGEDRFGLRAEFVDLVRLARLLSPEPAQTSGTDRN